MNCPLTVVIRNAQHVLEFHVQVLKLNAHVLACWEESKWPTVTAPYPSFSEDLAAVQTTGMIV